MPFIFINITPGLSKQGMNWKKGKITCTVNKKQKILKLFQETEWINLPDGKTVKIFTKDDFEIAGLYGEIENASQHCDLIYARKIIQSLGHKVLIGGGFFVWQKGSF